MDPTLSSFLGGVQAFEHGIGNANCDTKIGARESFKDKWVGVKELDFGEVV